MLSFRHTSILLVLLGSSLCACRNEKPPAEMVANQIKAALPAYWEVHDVATTLVEAPSGRQLKFQATASAKENLFTQLRIVAGTPPVIMLSRTTSSGQRIPIYGEIAIHRSGDEWTLARPQFDLSGDRLGSPRLTFGGNAHEEGSPEAEEALKLQQRLKELADRHAKAQEDAMRQVAEAEIREAEEAARLQQQKELEKKKARMQAAEEIMTRYAAGTKWFGTWKSYNRAFPIHAEILQCGPDGFEVCFSDPKVDGEFRVFAGAIHYDPADDCVKATGSFDAARGKADKTQIYPLRVQTEVVITCTAESAACRFNDLNGSTIDLKPIR